MKVRQIKEKINERYGKIALEGYSESCCAHTEWWGGSEVISPIQIAKSIGYDANELESVPESSILGVGCGALVSFADIKVLVKLADKLTSNQKKFVAEVIGTFIVVVFATGSVVIDAKLNKELGVSFIAFAPFVGITIGVYLFGKISMAHFNPAVTIGFLITKNITKIQLAYYFCAEIIGALLGSLFVKHVIGSNANLGANAPNYSFPIPVIFRIEVLASALLMAVIFTVVYTKGLKGFGGIAIGGIVGLDIFFLAFISGASISSCITIWCIR